MERIIAMIDEIYDRHYQAARSDLNTAIGAGFGHLGRALGNSFAVLHRIEYDAPWSRKGDKVRLR